MTQSTPPAEPGLAQPPPARPPRPASPASLAVRGVRQSVTELHEAWSQALNSKEAADARTATLGQWAALSQAVQLAAMDRQEMFNRRGAGRVPRSLPPVASDIAALLGDESPDAQLHWLEIAHLLAVLRLTEAMKIIEGPSVRVTSSRHPAGAWFFDAGGLQLLQRRATLLGHLEDQLDVELDEAARPFPEVPWTRELSEAIALVGSGFDSSALPHLLVALRLLLTWAVPEMRAVNVELAAVLDRCPSLRERLCGPVRRAQELVSGMASGQPAPLSECLVLADYLAREIGMLTVMVPRDEVRAAIGTMQGG